MKSLSRLAHGFAKAINRSCGSAHFLGEVAAFLLLIEVSYTVVMRYIFNNPPTWSEEIACYLFIFVVLVPIGGVLKDDHHIRLDLVLNRLPPNWRMLLQICISLAGAFFCFVVFYYGAKYVIFQYEFNFRSSTLLEVPYWITYLIIPLAFILITLEFVVKISGYISSLFLNRQEKGS